MLKTIKSYLVLFFAIITFPAYSQGITYFHKIENVTMSEKLASVLYKKLDSIKQTRRHKIVKLKFYSQEI
jgi:hypothetical protein